MACCKATKPSCGDPEEQFCTFIKYKLEAFYSSWFREELPPNPIEGIPDHPEIILGGRAHRFLLALRKRDPSHFWSLVCSVKAAKDAMPALNPNPKLGSYADRKATEAFTLLTTKQSAPEPVHAGSLLPPSTNWLKIEKLERKLRRAGISPYISMAELKRQIERTVLEIRKDAPRYTDEERYKHFFPSVRANNQTSVKDGGTLAWLQREGLLPLIKPVVSPDDVKVNIEHGYIPVAVPYKMETYQEMRQYGSEEVLEQAHREFNERQLTDEERRELRMHPEEVYRTNPASYTEGMIIDDSRLVKDFRSLLEEVKERALTEDANADLVILAEPLKFRHITKGPPYTYMVLKPLQKFLHGILRRHPCFQLIGKPIDEEIVQRRLKGIWDDEKVKSGDYKASTNYMRACVSNWCADAIAEAFDLDWKERHLMKTALTGHIMRYTRSNGTKFELPQMEGQLMGSIISFPILCIVNAAVCRWAMEISERKHLSLISARLLINGDDCVFPVTNFGNSVWKACINTVGWSESAGKNYFSNFMCNMNSRTFLLFSRENSPFLKDFRQVDQVNLGVVRGVTMNTEEGRSEGTSRKQVTKATLEELGALSREIGKECPPAWKGRAMLEFIHWNRSELDKSGARPWFFPKFLGGIGLEPVGPHSRSKKDRRRAEAILRNYGLHKPITAVPKVGWEVHDIVSKKIAEMPRVPFLLTRDEFFGSQNIEANNEKLYGALCVEALFTHPLSDLMPKLTKKGKRVSPAVRMNKHNQKIWTWAMEHIHGGEGLSDWDLQPRTLLNTVPVCFKPSERVRRLFTEDAFALGDEIFYLMSH
jgi:hypothetical protein